MYIETVLCAESRVFAGLRSGALTEIGQDSEQLILRPQELWFAPRSVVEGRRDYRQLIPYVVMLCGDSVLAYRRTKHSSARSLHGLLSLGFGGHVGLEDVVLSNRELDVEATLSRAARREVSEEIYCSAPSRRRRMGMVYDDQDPVSEVHVGLVELWELPTGVVRAAEPTIGDCIWIRIPELVRYVGQMESWSAICARQLTAILAADCA